MMLASPVFIVGAPRSGTTLLQCMLGVHPQMFSLPETHFFEGILPALGIEPQASITPDNLQRINELVPRFLGRSWSQDTLAHLLRQSRAGSLTAMDIFAFITDIYRPPSDTGKRLRLIEKTPGHLFKMDQILDHLPTACFVNLIRDPKDVVSSLMVMPTAKSHSVLVYAHSWNICIQAAAAFENRHPKKILSIRYEDLVDKTEGVLKKVCEFLDLNFLPEMISDFGDSFGQCVLPGETWKTEIQSGQVRNKSGVWCTRINIGQAWIVEQETRFLAGRCKYRAESDPSDPEKSQACATEARIIRTEIGTASEAAIWLEKLDRITPSDGTQQGQS